MPIPHYDSDLSDEEWLMLEPLLPKRMPKGWGAPILYSYRDILDAILYLAKTGVPWRLLPHDFPPWTSVWSYFSKWRDQGVWTIIHDTLRGEIRVAMGHERDCSAAVLDSQSVKASHLVPRPTPEIETSNARTQVLLSDATNSSTGSALHDTVESEEAREAQEIAKLAPIAAQTVQPDESIEGMPDLPKAGSNVSGFDAGKKINGRKRHLLVDTLGLLLAVVVHPANVQDRDGGRWVLQAGRQKSARLLKVWADKGYRGKFVDWSRSQLGLSVEIVSKPDHHPGFSVEPRRWVVERTFAWLARFRRLSKEFERTVKSAEAMIHLAMISTMITRLAHPIRRTYRGATLNFAKAA